MKAVKVFAFTLLFFSLINFASADNFAPPPLVRFEVREGEVSPHSPFKFSVRAPASKTIEAAERSEPGPIFASEDTRVLAVCALSVLGAGFVGASLNRDLSETRQEQIQRATTGAAFLALSVPLWWEHQCEERAPKKVLATSLIVAGAFFVGGRIEIKF